MSKAPLETANCDDKATGDTIVRVRVKDSNPSSDLEHLAKAQKKRNGDVVLRVEMIVDTRDYKTTHIGESRQIRRRVGGSIRIDCPSPESAMNVLECLRHFIKSDLRTAAPDAH